MKHYITNAVLLTTCSSLTLLLSSCSPGPEPKAQASPANSLSSNQTEEALPKKSQDLAQPVQINAAPIEELMKLPRIGSVTANKIIEGRPYVSANDLLRVSGIGEKTLEGILPFIEVTQGVMPPTPPIATTKKVELVSAEEDVNSQNK